MTTLYKYFYRHTSFSKSSIATSDNLCRKEIKRIKTKISVIETRATLSTPSTKSSDFFSFSTISTGSCMVTLKIASSILPFTSESNTLSAWGYIFIYRL